LWNEIRIVFNYKNIFRIQKNLDTKFLASYFYIYLQFFLLMNSNMNDEDARGFELGSSGTREDVEGFEP